MGQKKIGVMKFSKEKFYIITRERAEYGRRGQYELSTADGKDYCFFMDDTLGYEYFPVDSKIKECMACVRFDGERTDWHE